MDTINTMGIMYTTDTINTMGIMYTTDTINIFCLKFIIMAINIIITNPSSSSGFTRTDITEDTVSKYSVERTLVGVPQIVQLTEA
ncbi:hypothetical protein PoB_002434600 [Plakobranchus ocellatus]|uniref:Uncharacterized protein n=1 Tax=Plakobranchus ocellatus TaxID=259542 RepID=A0AAV3ZTI2_9GAST|nr:hypothetical protein PoB_002434600 [Plakobranchus ocellatus]